ncbi:tyrosine-type recombinase/integrase [Comamonas thiooxydans]|uniref:tyrosine-type recombinase/integrase n=1 Tax=Comamonas TaxID=283 RepID=UPI0009B6599C|nr:MULTISPECIES: tyrosine-type recombinase/integrase [Comamonas]BDR09425.1 tyrosine-type recombinase/integrase [Comamonas thiooxydans]
MISQSYQACSEPMHLAPEKLDKLVVSYIRLSNGDEVPLSFYGDKIWNYTPFMPHPDRSRVEKEIDWNKTPVEWLSCMKSAIAAFTFRKPLGGIQLDPATIPKKSINLNSFAKWCNAAGVNGFSRVTAFDLSRYIQFLRDSGVRDRTLATHISLLRKVYDLRHAMIESFSADAVTALRFEIIGPTWEPGANEERKTELIPLGEAARLFGAAILQLEDAPRLLKLRDELESKWGLAEGDITRKQWGATVKRRAVRAAGFSSSFKFETALADIRTAAYIILAMTTGCRVHELGDLRVGCIYPEVKDGETYWWLKSTTRKIGDGPARWLAPEIAKMAVDILEHHSLPIRQDLANQLITTRRKLSESTDLISRGQLAAEVLELERNVDRLFLLESPVENFSVTTRSHNKQLNAFAVRKGILLKSPLSTHRFRRTYAVIVVHLNKRVRIDLVTLQHHFKHASVLMTDWYASLSDTDRELYELIEAEEDYFDLALVDHWMEASTPLAGGLGKRIRSYAGKHHQPIFFKSRRDFVDSIREGLHIRSTGHSWCLAEAQDCGGYGLFDAPTCANCGNAVIDNSFTEVWGGLRAQHNELLNATDIGPGGLAKAAKGLALAEEVLSQLIDAEGGLHNA